MKIKDILKIIFPESYSCVCCGNEVFEDDKYVCESCYKSLPYIKGRICAHCGEPLVSDGDYCKRCKGKKFICDRIVSVFEFKDNVRKLILGLKYSNRKYIAKPLGKFLTELYNLSNFNIDFIVPVPLCEKRFKERKYNQAELIAIELANNINIEMKNDVLIRVRETPTQTKLDYLDRQANLKDAFKVKRKKRVQDKNILLIDDVYTTGATINECAKALKNAGVKHVYAITVCHTIKSDGEQVRSDK